MDRLRHGLVGVFTHHHRRLFIGPLINPRTSRPVLYTGIVACVAVIPLALICGPIRGIPFYWQLIDCSFGVFGVVPLLYCLRLLKRIESDTQSLTG